MTIPLQMGQVSGERAYDPKATEASCRDRRLHVEELGHVIQFSARCPASIERVATNMRGYSQNCNLSRVIRQQVVRIKIGTYDLSSRIRCVRVTT